MARQGYEGLIVVLLIALALARRDHPKRKPVIKWTDDEMKAFAQAVTDAGVVVTDALLVYTAESGLDPRATSGAAWGVPQMTGTTLRTVGWTTKPANFAGLSVAQQVPYIGRLLAQQVKIRPPGDALGLYVLNFSPRAASEGRDVLYRGDVISEANAYKANRRLDRAGKGYIDRTDLQYSLEQAKGSPAFINAVQQYKRLSNG